MEPNVLELLNNLVKLAFVLAGIVAAAKRQRKKRKSKRDDAAGNVRNVA